MTLSSLRKRGMSLQFFVWIGLSLIVFLMVVTFGSLALHQRVMRTLVGERDERAVRTAASALAEQLDHRAAAVRNLSLRAADGIPLDDILLSSSFLLPDFDAGLAFFSPEGQLLAHTGDDLLWTDNNDVFRAELDKSISRSGTEPRFSPEVPGPSGSKVVVLLSAAAQPGAPIIIGAFFPSTLAEHTLSNLFKTNDQGNICLISSNGKILFSSGMDNPLSDPISHPGVKNAL
ncbi:MAG: hypothetical protein ACC633_09200 [Anaerolineales bacterium]